MNNLLLPNNDFLYELLDMPFPSTISHDNNFTYMDSNPNNLNFLNTPHFQGNYNPYHDEPSINPTTESCTTVNSSANFAFQPSSDNPFLFTPLKKDVIFNWNDYGANSDHQVPTFRTISPSLSLGSEASCSFHRPVPVPVPIQDNAQSKYLQVVQGILSEVTSYVLADTTDSLHELNIEPSPKAISGVSSNDILASEEVVEGKIVQQELNAQRQELLNLLQLIDDRYNKCLDQIQNISSKFTNCTGSNETGTVHAPFAHVAISSRYKNLRERITKEIISISQQNVSKKHENEKEKGFELSFITKWASQQKEKIKRTESQCWRPQRGLPEKSVSVLRAWMFQNFLRPYPNDNEKDLLATKAGLSRSQVSNWFINARVRLWKPMIEEMYAELSKIKETEDISLNQGSSSK